MGLDWAAEALVIFMTQENPKAHCFNVYPESSGDI